MCLIYGFVVAYILFIVWANRPLYLISNYKIKRKLRDGDIVRCITKEPSDHCDKLIDVYFYAIYYKGIGFKHLFENERFLKSYKDFKSRIDLNNYQCREYKIIDIMENILDDYCVLLDEYGNKSRENKKELTYGYNNRFANIPKRCDL